MTKTFFGGSFDPPHAGHLGAAKAAIASGKCSKIVWFPAYVPPHKLNADRAPFADRMNMVRILISSEPDMEVSDLEAQLKFSPSYTIDILDHLEKIHHEKFNLLIGADSLSALHTWHKAEELASRFDLITYPRAGYEITMDKLLEFWDEKTAEKLLSNVLDGTFFEISSTEVKNSMEKNTLKHHIIETEKFPQEIREYIREHGLYRQKG